MEVLRSRWTPGDGLYLSLTRRCPLTCRHCSTNSTMESEEHSGSLFREFVATFTPENRPETMLMTGGEALLRPRLVEEIAHLARRVGTHSYLLSGMFFARGNAIPDRIKSAIDAVDHFSASLDAFHEEEVSRWQVLRVLRQLLDEGKDVSMQVVGLTEDDPYLRGLIEDIRTELDDRAPIWVTLVGAHGRAKDWLETPSARTDSGPHAILPEPCSVASWPVVTYDGTIVACCNNNVVDGLGGRLPAHLRLGHAGTDDWETVRARLVGRQMLRAVRVFGPKYLAARSGVPTKECGGYCDTCYKLSDDPTVVADIHDLMARPGTSIIEGEIPRLVEAAGVEGMFKRYGGAFGELLRLGWDESAEVAGCAG